MSGLRANGAMCTAPGTLKVRLLSSCCQRSATKESAQSWFRRAIRHGAPAPRVINTDLAPILPNGHRGSAALGQPAAPLPAPTRSVPQQHRGATSPLCEEVYCGKARLPGVRIGAAHRDGYKAVHKMRKVQVRWLPARDIVRHNLYIDRSSASFADTSQPSRGTARHLTRSSESLQHNRTSRPFAFSKVRSCPGP
jgi:hypothetical protein